MNFFHHCSFAQEPVHPQPAGPLGSLRWDTVSQGQTTLQHLLQGSQSLPLPLHQPHQRRREACPRHLPQQGSWELMLRGLSPHRLPTQYPVISHWSLHLGRCPGTPPHPDSWCEICRYKSSYTLAPAPPGFFLEGWCSIHSWEFPSQDSL